MILFCKFIFNYCNFLILKLKHFLQNLYYPSVVIIEFTFSIHDIVYASFVKEIYQAKSKKESAYFCVNTFSLLFTTIVDSNPSKIRLLMLHIRAVFLTLFHFRLLLYILFALLRNALLQGLRPYDPTSFSKKRKRKVTFYSLNQTYPLSWRKILFSSDNSSRLTLHQTS
jgi:hypothetical protein